MCCTSDSPPYSPSAETEGRLRAKRQSKCILTAVYMFSAVERSLPVPRSEREKCLKMWIPLFFALIGSWNACQLSPISRLSPELHELHGHKLIAGQTSEHAVAPALARCRCQESPEEGLSPHLRSCATTSHILKKAMPLRLNLPDPMGLTLA